MYRPTEEIDQELTLQHLREQLQVERARTALMAQRAETARCAAYVTAHTLDPRSDAAVAARYTAEEWEC